MKNAAITLGIIGVAVAFLLLREGIADRSSPPSPIVVEREHHDSSGKRLAPVFARGPKERSFVVADEVPVLARPDYVEVGEYRVEHQAVTPLANRALKESGKGDVVISATEETPYFQVVQVIDGLRRSDAKVVWLITREAIQPPETTRGK